MHSSAGHVMTLPVDPLVEVADLVKRYPKSSVDAVDGVSFRVGRGEVFGLLGPNGAGKSTTIGILTTRVVSTNGTARIAGVDVARDPVTARRLLAVVPLVPGESMLEINVMPGDDRDLDAVGLESSLAALPGVERVEQVKARTPVMAGAGVLPGNGDRQNAAGPRPRPGTALPPGMAVAVPGANGQSGGARMRLYCAVDATSLIPPVVGLLADRDESLDDLSLGRPSLEDVFIHVTGRDLRG